MIRAMLFDLDGTLVQTERLKAISYARAAHELCPETVAEAAVMDAYREVVGLSRQEVATALLERFGLESRAAALMQEFGVQEPWQAFVQVRLRIYEHMLADPDLIRSNCWPHSVALLHLARRRGCRTALATMSRCRQAGRILDLLGLRQEFDFVATRDDVEHAKPDPEIYLLLSRTLQIPPHECLVIEDSPAGVQAAIAADMHVIAVATPFTRERLHTSCLLPESHIVDDAVELLPAVEALISRLRRGAPA
ncbi:MAG: HAD family phosphatase [Caldilineae bacterium]|nr:MAG: HAD family phosphatase [Caldilineae bacterium]